MGFSEVLVERIRQGLAHKKGVTEKKLFGCFCLLLHGNVCVGVWKQSLLVRVGADEYEYALKEPCVREFNITGRPLTGSLRPRNPSCGVGCRTIVPRSVAGSRERSARSP